MNPEIQQIYDDLQSKVAELVQNFWTKLSKELETAAAANTASQPAGATGSSGGFPQNNLKSLPWFQHGMRGFLRKLWYGNHPENPSWRNLPTEQFVGRKLTLQEYAEIKSELILAIEANSGVSGIVNDLANQIMSLVGVHLKQAYEIGQKTSSSATPPKMDTMNDYMRKRAEQNPPNNNPTSSPPPATTNPTNPVDVGNIEGKPKETPTAEPPTVTNPEPVSATPEVKARKRRAKTLAPVTTRDSEQGTNPQANIEDAVLEFITAHAQQDQGAMKQALEKAGVKFLGKARIEGLPILVRMVHKMSQDNDLGLEKNDWIEPAKYKEIFGKVFNLPQLRKAIADLHKELEDNSVSTRSNFDNIAAAPSDHDPLADHTLPERTSFYVNLLKESKLPKPKHQVDIERSKTLNVKDKVNYFKECLSH